MPKLPYEAMLVRPAQELPEGPDQIYEWKFDGYRMFGVVALGGALLLSRHGTDYTDRYTHPVQQLPLALGNREAIVDGEMVGLDRNNREDFHELTRRRAKVTYYVFDLLWIDGAELLHLPLAIRRGILESDFEEQENVKLSPIFYDRDPTLKEAREYGMEGVISKDLSSPYIPGPRRRTRFWQKQKFRSGRHFL